MAAALAELSDLLARTVDRLQAAAVPDEALATVKRARGLMGLSGASRMVPAGRVWRLGVLLLDATGRLYATGGVTRAIVPLRAVTNRSAAAEERREDRRSAARGPFPEGEVVNFGYTALALDTAALEAGSGPLSVRDGVVMVRWSDGDATLGIRELSEYLADRVGLLVEDPIG
jgi:hypothetical protein